LKYCWNCGAQLQKEDAKFCSECGTSLVSAPITSVGSEGIPKQSEPNDIRPDTPRPISTKQLGNTLEDNVASIFKSMGYDVKVRQRFSTQSGTAEIDILLTKGNRKRGVECKNYGPSRQIGIKELRDFKGRLEQVGILSGLFVTNTFFSGEAEQYADSTGIETWDKSDLQEKLLIFFTGRNGVERTETLQALRVAQPFAAASAVNLENGQSVRLITSLLVYHPYYLVKYRVYGTRKDPTGQVHKIVDEDTCIIDAIDGDVTNRESGIMEGISGLLGPKEKRIERKEDKLITRDLMSGIPESQTLASTSDYQTKALEPQVSDSGAWKIAREYVIDKNTRSVQYEPKKSDDGFPRTMKITPKDSEVFRRGLSLVYVPKWDLEYESGQMTFQRRSLASSGTTIRDSIAKCEKCSILHRSTIAVCDICGLPLCEKHAYEEAGALLCENHISNEMRQKLKANSFMSKVFRRSG
jgi:hypothetical protein